MPLEEDPICYEFDERVIVEFFELALLLNTLSDWCFNILNWFWVFIIAVWPSRFS